MAFRIRVSNPTFNALTDTNPDHFALYADQDNILIKEKLRGSQSVSVSSSANIAHNLAYVPFCLVFVEDPANTYRKVFGPAYDGTGYFFSVTSTNLTLTNNTGATKIFKYYIFYDKVS